MKKIIRWLVILLLLVGIAYLFKIRIAQKHQQAAQRAVRLQKNARKVVKVEPVVLRTMYDSFRVITSTKGLQEISIHSDVPGKLIKYTVREGDYVKKGQVICLVERDVKGLKYKPSQVTTPISGYVANLLIDKGTLVSPQTPLAMVINYSKIELIANVPSVYYNKVRAGQSCLINIDGFDKPFHSKVASVSPLIDRRQNSFVAKIYLPNPSLKIKPGLLTTVEFILQKYANQTTVNRDAIIDRRYIFVYDPTTQKVQKRKINILFEKGDYAAVSGIREGEYYVVFGQDVLSNGEKVEVIGLSDTGGKK